MPADAGNPGEPEPEASSGRPRIRLLRQNPSFRWFWLGRTISNVGDGVAAIAFVLHVQETQRSGVAVGVLLLAIGLPPVLSPLAGAIVDRVDQRRLMMACDACQMVLFAAVAGVVPSYPGLVTVAVLSSFVATLFGPAGASSLAALVRRDELTTANAWVGTSLNAQVILGPVIGGALSAAFGFRAAIALDAGSFLVSLLMLTRVPSLPPVPDPEGRTGILRSTWRGVVQGMRHPVVRAVAVALFVGVGFAAMDNVALVFLAKQRGASDLAYGLLVSSFGLGMMAASLSLIRMGAGARTALLLLIGWGMVGLGTLTTAFVPLVAAMAVTQAVAGAGNGTTNVADNTLIQQYVPRSLMGRAFGLARVGAMAGGGVAAALAGWLVDLTSPATVFVIAGAGGLGVVWLLWAMLPRAVRAARGPAPPPAP
jgi:MFS family permease